MEKIKQYIIQEKEYTKLRKLANNVYYSVLAIITNFALKQEWKRNTQLLLFMHNISSILSIYAMINFFIFIVLFFNKQYSEKKDYIYLLLIIVILNPFQLGSGLSFDFAKIAQLTFFVMLTKESTYTTYQLIKEKYHNFKSVKIEN